MTAYPLPPGAPDGTLNREQLARAFDVSANTITKWIAKGMPVLSEGDNGRSYEFRLSACWSWRQEQLADAAAAKAEGDRIAQEAAQAFLNLGESAAHRESMSPREVREWAEAEIKRVDAARRRGEYTSTDKVEALVEGLLSDFQVAINTLPDWAEREFGLSVEQVVKFEARCISILERAEALIRSNRLGEAEVSEIRGGQGALL